MEWGGELLTQPLPEGGAGQLGLQVSSHCVLLEDFPKFSKEVPSVELKVGLSSSSLM